MGLPPAEKMGKMMPRARAVRAGKVANEAPRSNRRALPGTAVQHPVLHLVMPGLEVARETPRPRETVTAFLRRTGWAARDRRYGWQFRKGLPTILEINGEAVLRKSWSRRRIAANDNVRFVSYPLGGGSNGSKQVIGLLALVAVTAFSWWAGPVLAGAFFAGSALAGSLITAGIAIGGSLSANNVMPITLETKEFYDVGS